VTAVTKNEIFSQGMGVATQAFPHAHIGTRITVRQTALSHDCVREQQIARGTIELTFWPCGWRPSGSMAFSSISAQ
jgi:hypothetical protein